MTTRILDFRSDTVTKPTADMRAAILAAEVGDDVLGDDPTVLRLQERTAALLGKEAALFVPSGTMANLIGVRLHCRPGDEMICEAGAHVYYYEQGGYAQVNGVGVRTVEGKEGIVELDQLAATLRPENVHFTRPRLLCLENTHNRGGGRIQPYDLVVESCAWARAHGLMTHLDGARLMNAVVASGIPAPQWTEHFDTVGICFSKGLGAPVGSAICGPKDLIDEALRHRKVFGGGMRQVGILAAAALYALEHNIERLAEDHANARRLADGIRQIDGLKLASAQVDTNMVVFEVDPAWGTAIELVQRAERFGLAMLATGPQLIRAVTHLDVTAEDAESAVGILAEVVSTPARG